jgi:hypothetical protein
MAMAPLLLFQRNEGYVARWRGNIRFAHNLYPFTAHLTAGRQTGGDD